MAHEGGNLQNEVIREEHMHDIRASRVAVVDGDGVQITSFGGGEGGAGVAAYSDSGGTDRKGLVDADRHVQTDVLSSALPTGASTSANQTTLIGHVDGIETLLARPSSSSVTNKTMTGSAVELAASNTSRKGLYIHNYSGVTVYVKCGASASSTSFTVRLVDGAYYELPNPIYTGQVTALGASGDVAVTEIT